MRKPLRAWFSIPITLLCSCPLVSAAPPTRLDFHYDQSYYNYDTPYISQGSEFFHFRSRPDISAPKWTIDVYNEDALAPGYWFVSPYESLGQKERGEAWVGPYIYDGSGELIWSGVPMFDSFNIFDFRPIEIGGKHLFTAIYKRENAGIIADNSYQIQKLVRWPGGYDASNMHEFTTFDEGTKALVFSHEYHVLSKKESRVLGYDGECRVNTNGLLELDITSSPPTTLFNWSLIDHMSLDEATYPSQRTKDKVTKNCEDGWDFNHCNAIDRFPNDDYLISCRYTDALYKISRKTGAILWRLGGTKSDFKLVGDAKFSRQHHARVHEVNETHTIISLFDNARSEGFKSSSSNYTRGLILSLHDDIAEVVHEYPRPDYGYSTSRGSLQILPNGNVFMGWTFHSRISEHTADGEVLMQAKLPPRKNTYRSYKAPWIGRPVDPPDVLSNALYGATPDEIWTELYVSWNGATDVDRWAFYESDSRGSQRELLKTVSKTGFETFTEFNREIPYVIVEAIDIHGSPMGQSKVITTVPPERNAKNFLQEQQWQKEHLPSAISAAHSPTQNETPGSGAGQWDVEWRESEMFAYMAGLLTCLVVFMLFWIASMFKRGWWRRRKGLGYQRVNDGEAGDDEKVLERGDLDDEYERIESGMEKDSDEPG